MSYPLDGGVARHVCDLAAALDPSRWEVELAAPEQSLPARALAGLPHVRLLPLAAGRNPRPGDALELARLVRAARWADVVHAHSSKAGIVGRLAAVLAGRRATTIYTPHAWAFWMEGRAVPLWLGLERLAAHWCGTIVAVSAAERDSGLARGVGRPGQYRVIPNGVDLERYAGAPSPAGGRILALGRLDRQKRPDLAVAALRLVRGRFPQAELVFAGDGPLRGETEALARAAGLGDGVRFLGERADIPELLAEADCVVLASDYEGCPYSVLEAMAAGVPVVATRVGGVPELVVDGETGVLVEPRDPQALATGIERALGDPAWARRAGAAGRERARAHFSRERMLAGVFDLYESLA